MLLRQRAATQDFDLRPPGPSGTFSARTPWPASERTYVVAGWLAALDPGNALADTTNRDRHDGATGRAVRGGALPTAQARLAPPHLVATATRCHLLRPLVRRDGACRRRTHAVLLGLGLGADITSVMWGIDSPPSHIERWREGAEGEKATAKALRGLVRSRWTLLNDIDWGRGNIDHVLVGPPAIFVLETKKLRGTCSVQRGLLSVRWREDPADGYESSSIGPRTRAASAALAETLRADGLRRRTGCRVWLCSGLTSSSVQSRANGSRGSAAKTWLASSSHAPPVCHRQKSRERSKSSRPRRSGRVSSSAPDAGKRLNRETVRVNRSRIPVR